MSVKIGDVCVYSYPNENKSITIVEVVAELSETVVVVKFLQVIFDDSGNGIFGYLFKTGKTMNVSREYLCKLDFVDRQKNEAIGEFWNRLKVEGSRKVDYYTPEGCDQYFRNGTLCGYSAMKEVGECLVKEMTGGKND